MTPELQTPVAYRIHHTRASSHTLRNLMPYAQRTIENALAAQARDAAGSGRSARDEQVCFAGGMLLCGYWIAYAFDHDNAVLNVLTVEVDADAELNRQIPVAA